MAAHTSQTISAPVTHHLHPGFVAERKTEDRLQPGRVTGLRSMTSGSGSIAGIVKVGSIPVAGYRVALYDRTSGLKISETVSGEGGAYAFPYLDTARAFDVIAWDATGQYNAVIADNVRATP